MFWLGCILKTKPYLQVSNIIAPPGKWKLDLSSVTSTCDHSTTEEEPSHCQNQKTTECPFQEQTFAVSGGTVQWKTAFPASEAIIQELHRSHNTGFAKCPSQSLVGVCPSLVSQESHQLMGFFHIKQRWNCGRGWPVSHGGNKRPYWHRVNQVIGYFGT